MGNDVQFTTHLAIAIGVTNVDGFDGIDISGGPVGRELTDIFPLEFQFKVQVVSGFRIEPGMG